MIQNYPLENAKTRIYFLDGMRGIAILLVILFHAYARWPNLYPYGKQFSKFPLFKFGWLGVELFFLISGFVILMTLEKCSSFTDFMLRRWCRLFPAMLVCSVFIFLTARFFYERPAGIPEYRNLLPGLTFIDAKYFEIISKQPWNGLEGAFWSLYVEVKFYFIFGLLYFLFGNRLAILSLVALFIMSCFVTYAPFHMPYPGVFKAIINNINAEYFGWFASGAFFYDFYKTKKIYFLIFAILTGVISAALSNKLNLEISFAGSLVALFFASSLVSNIFSRLLSCRALVFMGFISYPLYLLHENMLVSLIIKLGKSFPSLKGVALPILSIFSVIVIGSFFAYYVEPLTKRLFVRPIYQGARYALYPKNN